MRSAKALFIGLSLLSVMLVRLQKGSTDTRDIQAFTEHRAESPIAKDSLDLDRKTGTIYYQGKLFTGIAITNYPNGIVAEKVSYIKGERNGLRQKWFTSGLISYEANYEANVLHGEVKSWWKNGKLRTISNFEHGLADGLQKEWYSDGALFKELNLNQGKEEGIQRAWRQNGKLYVNYEAKNGRIFGLKRANLCYELANEKIVFSD